MDIRSPLHREITRRALSGCFGPRRSSICNSDSQARPRTNGRLSFSHPFSLLDTELECNFLRGTESTPAPSSRMDSGGGCRGKRTPFSRGLAQEFHGAPSRRRTRGAARDGSTLCRRTRGDPGIKAGLSRGTRLRERSSVKLRGSKRKHIGARLVG